MSRGNKVRRVLKPNQLGYVEGDTQPALVGTITEDDGTPKDITGYQFAVHIKYDDGPKVVHGEIDNPAEGLYRINWLPDSFKPGRYFFEIQITDDQGGILTINRHHENDELLELFIDEQVA